MMYGSAVLVGLLCLTFILLELRATYGPTAVAGGEAIFDAKKQESKALADYLRWVSSLSGTYFLIFKTTCTTMSVSFDILSPSRPIRTMSGVLESSNQALSIRRIMGLIGRLLFNRSGQKRG